MSLDAELVKRRVGEARIYLLLTRRLCRLRPSTVLEEALRAGVGLVQVREPEMGDRELMEWVHIARERTALYGVPLVVNDRPDVCLLTGAEGVHVGQADLPPRAVRELIGPERLLGLSTHGRAQVEEAADEPVDYLGLGPLFDTPTKGLEGRGLGLIEEVRGATGLPVFGVGGVDADNVAAVTEAGLERVAVSGAICSAEQPGRVVEYLLAVLGG